LVDELESAGIGFIFANLLEVMASAAQFEAELISRRMKAGLAEAMELPYHTTSQNERIDTKTRHAFHFIRPLLEDGESYQTIADKLIEEGYRTRRGGKVSCITGSETMYKILCDSLTQI